MAWYEDWFDSELYELVYASRDERDAERLADLIVRVAVPARGAAILDVGTGHCAVIWMPNGDYVIYDAGTFKDNGYTAVRGIMELVPPQNGFNYS